MISETSLGVVNKGILGAIAGGIAIAIVAVVMFTPAIFHGAGQVQPTTGESGVAQPVTQEVTLSMTSIQIKQIDEKSATIEVVFSALNPNKNTLVLEQIQYDLIADGAKLAQSSIGERLEGVIVGTGHTYYLVTNLPVTLTDTVQIKKTERLASVWSSLQSNHVDWRIKGQYFITDPVRAAGQEKNFEFTS